MTDDYYYSTATNMNALNMFTCECPYVIIQTDLVTAVISSTTPYDTEYTDPDQDVLQIWFDADPDKTTFSSWR